MTSGPRPGNKGEPLPNGLYVFRLAIPPKDFAEDRKIDVAAFALSSRDRQSELKTLSVWVEQLTTVDQARNIMELAEADRRVVVRLNVDDIRAIRPEPDVPAAEDLDVIWEPLLEAQPDGTWKAHDRPGADGHAGILGLHEDKLPQNWARKSLRAQLRDLANQSAPLRLDSSSSP